MHFRSRLYVIAATCIVFILLQVTWSAQTFVVTPTYQLSTTLKPPPGGEVQQVTGHEIVDETEQPDIPVFKQNSEFLAGLGARNPIWDDSSDGAGANRAPDRKPSFSVVKIAHEFTGNAKWPTDLKQVQCWDSAGKPMVKTPMWLRSLFRDDVMSPTEFEVLRLVVEADPWRVLIGWPASRFMGPQAAGKKANGQIQEAPTRGRKPEYYRNKYNATWTGNVVSSGMEHNFQLVHRNALRVCIRERLHVKVFRCSPKISFEGDSTFAPPILIHHCHCRKCPEILAETTPPKNSWQELGLSKSGGETLLQSRIVKSERIFRALGAAEDVISPIQRRNSSLDLSSVLKFASLGVAFSVNFGFSQLLAQHVPHWKIPRDRSEPVTPYVAPPLDYKEDVTSSKETQEASSVNDDAAERDHSSPDKLKSDTNEEATKPVDPNCVTATSAPWLATKEVFPQFPYENIDHGDILSQLLRIQADSNRIVLVTIFNRFWLDHLHNFWFSMVRYAGIQNCLVATMDSEALELCRAQRLPCFDATAYSVDEGEDMKKGGKGYQSGHLRKVTEAMSWIKPRLAVAVLSRGYGFFMVDLDLTWNKFPMHEVLSARVDLAHQCDAHLGKEALSINSGFYLARPTPATLMYFHNLMLFTPDENSDQTAMKLFAKYDHLHGMRHSCLPKWSFNMKCNYKVDGSVQRPKNSKTVIETFQWRKFDRRRWKKGSFWWRMLHATCISGAFKKMIWLRTMNAWFLDDLDQITKNPYCLVLPSGDIKTEWKIQTVHSPTHSNATDAVFLQERH